MTLLQDLACIVEYCDTAYRCWDGWKIYCCYPDEDVEVCKKKRCFPSTAKLNLKNGESVTMSELQVGDRVQTGKHVVTFLSKLIHLAK